MNDPQGRKFQLPTIWLQMVILLLLGVLFAALASYVVADLRWRKSGRELAEFRNQAWENALKAVHQNDARIEHEDGRVTVLPSMVSPRISAEDRERIEALDLKNQIWHHRQKLAGWFASRSALLVAVLAVAYWFFRKSERKD